ncbi:MAG: N-6 DNA methylase [Nocardiopsaceae bacterium]|nr:N-6 DNA methylase [Nocardiopsaceae bacterium]
MPAEAERAQAPALLMSMPEIAELARVRRPVVSNWRRRHGDFPEPAGGTAARPLFDPRRVAEWLIATGRHPHDEIAPELAKYTLAALADQYPGPDLIAATTALICLRYLVNPGDELGGAMPALRGLAAAADPDDVLLRSEIRQIPDDAGWVAGLVDELTEATWGCDHAAERIMASRHRYTASSLYEGAVTPGLARLIAGISGAREQARRTDSLVVTDPVAGAGDLLVAVTGLLGRDHEPRLVAAEPDQALARLLRRRLVVHGIPLQDMDIHEGTLPRPAPDPDVLVTQIPYRPAEQADPLAVLDFLDEAALSLAAGRFAVVLGPASVLVGDLPSGAAARRAELLKADMVEAVIRLPGGCVPYRPGYETALWVLTQARGSQWRGRVLLADVSGRPLTADVARDLTDDVVTWRRDGYEPRGHHRVLAVQADVGALVTGLGPLIAPRRPVSPRIRKDTSDTRIVQVTRHGADLDRIGATASADRRHVRTELLAAVPATGDRMPATEAVGTLVRQHRLIMRKGTRIRPGDIDPSGHHVVLGADEVLGLRRPGERKVDRELFASRYPNARLTEPGDVLVTTSPRPGAIIDTRGYAIAESPVRILRIPPPKPVVQTRPGQPDTPAEPAQFTPRVLHALLFGDGAGTRPPGAVRPADSVDDLRVALLSPGQVAALEELLESIDARRVVAQREIDMLDELRHVATSGLTDGTLTVVSDDE